MHGEKKNEEMNPGAFRSRGSVRGYRSAFCDREGGKLVSVAGRGRGGSGGKKRI